MRQEGVGGRRNIVEGDEGRENAVAKFREHQTFLEKFSS